MNKFRLLKKIIRTLRIAYLKSKLYIDFNQTFWQVNFKHLNKILFGPEAVNDIELITIFYNFQKYLNLDVKEL